MNLTPRTIETGASELIPSASTETDSAIDFNAIIRRIKSAAKILCKKTFIHLCNLKAMLIWNTLQRTLKMQLHA